MKTWAKKQAGFTIVELLIVVVVIAILATITIVAYNGIRERAQTSSLQSSLSQAMKKVQASAVISAEQYPATLEEIGIKDGNGVTYQYTSDNTPATKSFCVTATLNQNLSYYISSKTGSTQQPGICPGHNLLVWYEDIAGASPPLPLDNGIAVDTSVRRGGAASMRMSPGTLGIIIKGGPYAISDRQVMTVSFWLKTDSNWNGLGNNSKIRFGRGSDGALIASCGYNGVKLDWTFVTCSYTSNGTIPTAAVTLSNDGTVGNIWIDDLIVSISSPS